MIQLSARARAEEAVYANRSKYEFVLQARSLRRLGRWAATKMQVEEPDSAVRYADALVKSQITGSDPIKCIAEDLRDAGVTTNEKALGKRLERYVTEARKCG